MNFPIRRAVLVDEYPAMLRGALTKSFKNVYLNEQAYIIEYESVQDVLDETPDFELLKQVNDRRTAITATGALLDVALMAGAEQYDCVSRYFAPSNGINEDPVTGSIHTGIVPIWAEKLGKQQLVAYQGSSRGGVLYCEMQDNDRIEISGYGKLYMKAEILL